MAKSKNGVTLIPANLARAEKFSGTGNPTLTTGDAPDSICPSGWRLPGYDGKQSYSNLMETYVNKGGAWYDGTGRPVIAFLAAPINILRPESYYIWIGAASNTGSAYVLRLDEWFYSQGWSENKGSSSIPLRCLDR